MKKIIALTLSLLMLITSALPIFAIEGETGTLPLPDGDKTASDAAKTYEDMYVPGALLAFNAFDAKEGDALVYGSALATAENGAALKGLSLKDGSTIAYGDGKLILKGGAQMRAQDLFDYTEELGATTAYTLYTTMEYLAESPATLTFATPDGVWTEGAVRYQSTTPYHDNSMVVFGIRFKTTFQNMAARTLQEAWYEGYQAALADESLRGAWRGGDHILSAHYDALVALETTDGVSAGTYAFTEDEVLYATWAGFDKLISGALDTDGNTVSAYYLPNTQKQTYAPAGIVGTVLHSRAGAAKNFWIANADGMTGSKNILLTGADYGKVHTRTDAVTMTLKEDGYYAHNYQVYYDGQAMGSITNKDILPINSDYTWMDVPMALYAVRLYGETLTADQSAQNRFADLCHYYGVDNLDVYFAMSEISQKALHTAFSTKAFADTDKVALEGAIADALANESDMLYRQRLEKLYVEGALLTWNAYGKDASDGTLSDKAVLATASNSAVLRIATYKEGATVAYGNGKLMLKSGSGLLAENLFEFPQTANESASYTMQIVMETIDETPAMLAYSKPSGAWTADGVRYEASSAYHQYAFKLFGMRQKVTLLDADTQKMQLAWYNAYQAALADESLRGAWRGGDHILSAHYDALVALESTDGVSAGTYAFTEDEILYATWAGFDKLISGALDTDGDAVSSYYVQNTKEPKSYPSGIQSTVIHAASPAWVGDADGQGGSTNVILSGRDYGTVFTRSDVAEITKNSEDALWTWKYSRYLDGEAAQGVFEKSNFKANDLAFSWYDMPAAFYAIRLYSKVLTEEEMAQNNFADLCNYYGIDALDAYEMLTKDEQKALHAQFAKEKIGSTDKKALDSAIEAVYAKRFDNAKAFAETLLTFDGYQMSLYSGVAFRAVFTVHSERSYAGMTVLEMGVLTQKATEETVLDDLTLIKGESGYESTASKSCLYADGEWLNTVELESGTTVYRETVSFAQEELTREKLTEEYVFRGYAICRYLDRDFVVYTDMSSTAFEDGLLSVAELSAHPALTDYPVSKQIKAILDAE